MKAYEEAIRKIRMWRQHCEGCHRCDTAGGPRCLGGKALWHAAELSIAVGISEMNRQEDEAWKSLHV